MPLLTNSAYRSCGSTESLPRQLAGLHIIHRGYLNRVPSRRRLEREAGRNVEVTWLTCRLVPDHKTIADFRKDNGAAIKQVCVQFVALCRQMGLLTNSSVAIERASGVHFFGDSAVIGVISWRHGTDP
jgi:hypothetical protein